MQSNLFKKHLPLIILITFCILIALARLHTYDEPFERDMLTYAVIAHETLAGRELYSDLLTMRPPLIILTYAAAELIAGYGPNAFYLLNIVAAIITLFGVYFAGTALAGGQRSGGLWAAACWTVISGDLTLQANQPNAEVFINACLIWVWVLLVKTNWNSRYRQAILIGLLVALASLYKQFTIVAFFLLGGTYIIMPPSTLDRRQAFLQVMIMVSIVGVIWAMVVGYFAFQGRFEAFYEAIIVIGRYYAGDIVKNVLRGLLRPRLLFPFFPPLAYPLLGLAAILGIIILLKRNRIWIFWLIYAIAIQIIVAFPGSFFPHYYQLWLPILAVGFGGVIIELGKLIKPLWIPQVVATIVMVAVLYWYYLPQYQLDPVEWSRKKYGDLFIITKNLAPEIDNLLKEGETFYDWGYDVGFYYYTQRHPPTGVLVWNFLRHFWPLAQKLSQRVIADLERHQPEILILSHEGKTLANKTIVLEWLFSKYTWIPLETKTKDASKYFSVFVRRGGNLESRLWK